MEQADLAAHGRMTAFDGFCMTVDQLPASPAGTGERPCQHDGKL